MRKQNHINKLLDDHLTGDKGNTFFQQSAKRNEKVEEEMPPNIDEIKDSNKILIFDKKPNFLQSLFNKVKSLFSIPVKKEGYEELQVEPSKEPEDEISQDQIDELIKQ